VVVAHLHGAPLRLHYRVRCDGGYRVREVVVELPAEAKRVELRSDGEGRWTNPAATRFRRWTLHRRGHRDDAVHQHAAHRTAQALAWRITRPERRVDRRAFAGGQAGPATLHLAAGETAIQRSGGTRSGDFSADLDVDARGLVLSYAGFWQRVGP